MKISYLKVIIPIAVLLSITGLWVYAGTDGKADKTTRISNQPNTTAVKGKGKILVTYFTWPEPDGVDGNTGASRIISNGRLYGNTEFVAHIISEATGGDLFAIKTERTYPSPHQALIDAAKVEADAKQHPRLKTHISNIRDYDIIFVGYPNWWYDMPMAIYSFFDEYDFNGKTIIPFVTHGGSSFSNSVENIARIEKGANQVIKGPSVYDDYVPDAKENIVKWLQKQGLAK